VAILARTVFIESIGRYREIFEQTPPTKFAQFTEPMIKGRFDAKASTATGYAWIVWEKNVGALPRLIWVPPVGRSLKGAPTIKASGCLPSAYPPVLAQYQYPAKLLILLARHPE
jgi:hypothetical protein